MKESSAYATTITVTRREHQVQPKAAGQNNHTSSQGLKSFPPLGEKWAAPLAVFLFITAVQGAHKTEGIIRCEEVKTETGICICSLEKSLQPSYNIPLQDQWEGLFKTKNLN